MNRYTFKVMLSCSVVSIFCNPLEPARLLCPWHFPGKNYWSGLPCPPPEDLPNPGIKPHLLHWQAILHHCATWEAQSMVINS